jgi:hypothetical protein
MESGTERELLHRFAAEGTMRAGRPLGKAGLSLVATGGKLEQKLTLRLNPDESKRVFLIFEPQQQTGEYQVVRVVGKMWDEFGGCTFFFIS